MTRPDEELEKAVGQLIIGGFEGLSVPDTFRDLAKSGRIGGAILFSRNIESLEATRDLVEALTEIGAEVPLLISVDQEGGRVQRLRAPFIELPPMRVFGEKGRKSLVHRMGTLLAQALRVIGFHQNYAPVLDVDSNPNNPIIGDRAFSRDTGMVCRLGSAFIDGLQEGGVAACGKHFPGHGDTDVDSHLALPKLPFDLERLKQRELAPFRAAVRTGVASIMTAHILFDALDPEHPATLSEKVLVPILRDYLGYEGVIVSDDLEMKAIADHYGIGDAAVRAIRAGCDQLLICSRVDWAEEAHAALVQSVKDGHLPRARVMEAAGRVHTLKAGYVFGRRPADGDVVSQLPTQAHAALLEELGSSPEYTPVVDAIVEYDFEGDATLEMELDRDS